METENKEKNEKDINLKMSINEDKEKDKEKNVKDKKDNNKKPNKNKNVKKTIRIKYNTFNGCYDKKYIRKRRRRNCNFITILRDVFITIIVVSALAFYATIFIVG